MKSKKLYVGSMEPFSTKDISVLRIDIPRKWLVCILNL